MTWSDQDRQWMQRAIELAARGQGFVEPNPMVGCVIVQSEHRVGEGWHQRFGGPHAEVEALTMAGEMARGATMYVTLEPCCHFGKTPPCVNSILVAGVRKVVVSEQDPFQRVSGGGIAALREANVEVLVGLCAQPAHELNAPFHMLVSENRPWVIAKWAMTLDGKIATRTGSSRWISNEESRAFAHRLRGRVDAVIVGRGTVEADDPLLTARPPGARIATRVVLDSQATLADDSRLLKSVGDAPILVVAGSDAPTASLTRLKNAGCDAVVLLGLDWSARLPQLMSELGQRRMSNVLIEGGAQVLGGFFDQTLVDEVHVFLNPRVIGGSDAPSPVGGLGIDGLGSANNFKHCQWEQFGTDLHFSGRTARG